MIAKVLEKHTGILCEFPFDENKMDEVMDELCRDYKHKMTLTWFGLAFIQIGDTLLYTNDSNYISHI